MAFDKLPQIDCKATLMKITTTQLIKQSQVLNLAMPGGTQTSRAEYIAALTAGHRLSQ